MLDHLEMGREMSGGREFRLVLVRIVAAVGVLSITFGGGFGDGTGPIAVAQQDAEDATAGATGADGTVNGVPRETGDESPIVVTGPGVPLPPPDVILPPSVPGLAVVPDAGADPALPAAAAQPTELVFNAISDTSVFSTEPGAPQTEESAALLAFGGPQGALSLISFEITGTAGGSIVSALLNFTGASSSPGGGVNVIYDYVVPAGLTYNGVPGAASAVNFHGAPAWFDRVEESGLTSVDISGSISGDGVLTFVLVGQPDEQSLIYAIESGITPQVVLTVMQPA